MGLSHMGRSEKMEGIREKLIAIIEQARQEAVGTVGSMNGGFAAWYADKLIAAGGGASGAWGVGIY